MYSGKQWVQSNIEDYKTLLLLGYKPNISRGEYGTTLLYALVCKKNFI